MRGNIIHNYFWEYVYKVYLLRVKATVGLNARFMLMHAKVDMKQILAVLYPIARVTSERRSQLLALAKRRRNISVRPVAEHSNPGLWQTTAINHSQRCYTFTYAINFYPLIHTLLWNRTPVLLKPHMKKPTGSQVFLCVSMLPTASLVLFSLSAYFHIILFMKI